MTDVTRRAIVALLAADETATEKERTDVAIALRGDIARKVTFKEACARLGISRPTLHRLVKSGRLTAMRGTRKNAIGITLESFERFLRGEDPKKQEESNVAV